MPGDVFLDEFAMHSDDREIWAAMFPAVLRGNGELDIASTPNGRNNVFYQLRENQKFTHTTVTLPDAVAQGLNVDIDEIRQAMDDDLLFRQEFLCEFVDEAVTFLTYDQIAACVDPELVPRNSVEAVAAETRELFIASGLRIGRQADDANAAGKGDLQLFDAEVLEDPVVVIVVGDFKGVAVLPGLGHELAALAFAGGEEDLVPAPEQAAEDSAEGLRKAFAGLAGPAAPLKARIGFNIPPLIVEQWDDRHWQCRLWTGSWFMRHVIFP